MKTSYRSSSEFRRKLREETKRLGLTVFDLSVILESCERSVHHWLNDRAPHILTQEAILARLAKQEPYQKEIAGRNMLGALRAASKLVSR